MALSPEEKQRIENEEQDRIAEVQYRQEVRARLQETTLPEGRKKWQTALGVLLLVVAIYGAMLIGADVSRKTDVSLQAAVKRPPSRSISSVSLPRIRPTPARQKIADGQIVVTAQGYVRYKIEIDDTMREARLTGSFNASGGSGNDITAAIATESEHANWINGHEARVYWSTEGKKTTGRFDVRLPPGTYYLAFSNQWSLVTNKYVFLNVDLSYQRTAIGH